MLKRSLIVTALTFVVTLTAVASDRDDDIYRTQKAAQVFQEVMRHTGSGYPSGFAGIGKMHQQSFQGTRNSPSYLAAATGGEWQPVAPRTAGAPPCL